MLSLGPSRHASTISHVDVVMRVRDCSDLWRAFLLAALDENGVGGWEANGGLPFVGQPLEGCFTPETHVGGVLDVVPC